MLAPTTAMVKEAFTPTTYSVRIPRTYCEENIVLICVAPVEMKNFGSTPAAGISGIIIKKSSVIVEIPASLKLNNSS
jgi:hypothetical protein